MSSLKTTVSMTSLQLFRECDWAVALIIVLRSSLSLHEREDEFEEIEIKTRETANIKHRSLGLIKREVGTFVKQCVGFRKLEIPSLGKMRLQSYLSI